MSHLPIEYIRHILDEVEYLCTAAKGLDIEEFLIDDTRKRAFVRSLEIIGEAVKNIPVEFKQKYPQIDWRAMAGMRDKLIHHYFGIDYEIVWDVIFNEIPVLRQEVNKILKDEEDSQN